MGQARTSYDPTVRLNTDASVVRGKAAGGGLLRDSEGRLIFEFYKEFGEASVLLAEGLSLYTGLQMCWDLGARGSTLNGGSRFRNPG